MSKIVLHRVFLVGTGKASAEKIPEIVQRVKEMMAECNTDTGKHDVEYIDTFCPSIGETGTKVEVTVVLTD